MNESERKELRALVRTMYDYQDMRLRTAARLRLDAKDMPIDETCMGEAEISEKDYETLEYVKITSLKTEKKIGKEIEKIVKAHPLWGAFFEKVLGCGPLMSAAILSEIDIVKADTRSKIYQFAGLNPGMICGKKIVKINKKTDMSQIIKEYENKAGERCGIVKTSEMVRGDRRTIGFVAPYNAWLRTKLCGVLAGGMVLAGRSKNENKLNYAVKYYYPYKARLEQEKNQVMHIGKMTAWKDVSPGHRDAAAKRYMIKMFISDLYEAWRKVEGLPVRASYQEEYLGHKHAIGE